MSVARITVPSHCERPMPPNAGTLETPPVGSVRRVEAAGRSLGCWDTGGTGPVVVLVHGIPTNHVLWWDVAPRLAPHARVLAVDLLGYGRSDRPDGHPVDIAAHADRLVALLDALGVARATVVGHDIGGGIAQIVAVRHAGRVERLALVDAVCYDAWPVPAMQALKLAARGHVLEHLPGRPTMAALRAGLRTLFVHQERADRFVEAFTAPFASADGMDAFAAHVRTLDSRQTEAIGPALRELALPVAIVWGRQDHQLPPALAERLARDIPGAELTWVEDASHFVPCDRPDAVADAILRLLARDATPRPAAR